jgi:hypothetical protein
VLKRSKLLDDPKTQACQRGEKKKKKKKKKKNWDFGFSQIWELPKKSVGGMAKCGLVWFLKICADGLL